MSGILFAVILGASAIAAMLLAARVRISARLYLRFACVLFASLACACFLAGFLPSFGAPALAIALLVAALAPMALALATLGAFATPPSSRVAAAALVIACLAGLAGAVTGFVPLAFAPLMLASLVIAVTVYRRAQGRIAFQGAVSSMAFLLGAFAFMESGTQFLLFFAGGILGLTLTLVRVSNPLVEEACDLRRAVTIAR